MPLRHLIGPLTHVVQRFVVCAQQVLTIIPEFLITYLDSPLIRNACFRSPVRGTACLFTGMGLVEGWAGVLCMLQLELVGLQPCSVVSCILYPDGEDGQCCGCIAACATTIHNRITFSVL